MERLRGVVRLPFESVTVCSHRIMVGRVVLKKLLLASAASASSLADALSIFISHSAPLCFSLMSKLAWLTEPLRHHKLHTYLKDGRYSRVH